MALPTGSSILLWLGTLTLAVVAVAAPAALTAEPARIPVAARVDLEKAGPFPFAPLAADPAGLAAAASSLPAVTEAPAQMIFQESRFDFDAAGRITFHRHWIYRILRAEGLRDWGVSQVRFSPWHQDRPRARVRVIEPDGRERRFETSSYTEKPAAEGREDLFGDRRVLELKLPVAVGSIVEEEIEVADIKPYFAAGTTLRHYASLYIPVLRGRLVLEAPTGLPLRYGVRLLPGLEPRKQVQAGRVRLEFDYPSMPAASAVEVGMPGHRPRFPHIAFSTGRSWQEIASLYYREVEAALQGASLEDWPRPPANLARREQVAFLLAALQARVRTNNLELGARSPLPRSPADTALDGRGDGKDIATLMMALLRRSGLDARLVLLSSGFGPDSESKLPGLGLFNHAVLRLPPLRDPAGKEIENAFWLDPSTPFVRVGELPLPAQGRFALVVDPQSRELELTPATKPFDNRTEERREVFFADYGLGRIVEKSVHWGSADRNQRQVTEGLEPAIRRRGYQAYVMAMHGASTLGEVRETSPSDFQEPFTLQVEALGCAKVKTDFDQAVLDVPVREMLRRLPNVFLVESLPPRQEEFIFHEPFETRWTYVIHLPAGFSAGEMPAERTRQLGPGRLRIAFHSEGDTVYGELSLDVGQRLLSANQFEAMRKAVLEITREADPRFVFPHRGEARIAAGKPGDALKELRAAVANEPLRVSHRARLARVLMQLGFHFEAQRQAREATRLAPGWAASYLVLGRALTFDELGRRFSPFADLEAAEKALVKAAELEPNDPRTQEELQSLRQARRQLGRIQEERPELHPDDPQTPLKKLLLAHLGGDGENALTLLHPRSRELVGLAALEPLARCLENSGEGAGSESDGSDGSGRSDGSDPAPKAGETAAAAATGDTGDPLQDWQARLAGKAAGAPHLGYRLSYAGCRAYLSRSGASLFIVGSSEEPALLGLEALARLDDGDPEGAYRWLDWARQDALDTPRSEDPLAAASWLELWKGQKEESENTLRERARLAAAALAAPLDKKGVTLPLLTAVSSQSPGLGAAHAAALEAAGRFAELNEVATGLLSRYPDSPRARRWSFAALRGLGDADALFAAIEARLAIRPLDPEALRAKAFWSAQVGTPERATGPLLLLREKGPFTSQDGAHLIFAALGSQEQNLASLERAAELTRNLPATAELLAARAALAAEFGQIEETRQLLREAAALRVLKAPRNEDLYLDGRLAEYLGLAELARDLYQRLPPPSQGDPFSYALLARRRPASR